MRKKPWEEWKKQAMSLSLYEPLNPDMEDGNGQKRVEAHRETLPADDQATVLFLEPGECALSLEARTSILSGRPRGFLVFQTRFGNCARMPRRRSCWRRALES